MTQQAIERGVRYRVVLERAVLDTPGALAALAGALGNNEEVRVAARVPTKLIMADRRCAMLPLNADSALVVRAPALLDALVDIFETAWRQAQSVRLDVEARKSSAIRLDAESAAAHAHGPDTLELRILSLMLVGSTDQAIANQLGIGLRSVERKVRALMNLAGVDTRVQLGWHARDREWIGR